MLKKQAKGIKHNPWKIYWTKSRRLEIFLFDLDTLNFLALLYAFNIAEFVVRRAAALSIKSRVSKATLFFFLNRAVAEFKKPQVENDQCGKLCRSRDVLMFR